MGAQVRGNGSAEPWARAAAERLARELGVLVEPSSPPGAGAAQGPPQAPETGTAFDQAADPRLGAPFEQGRHDGTRRSRSERIAARALTMGKASRGDPPPRRLPRDLAPAVPGMLQ
jgi:hypothetical protein